jgi:hypothetical protein
LLLKYWICVIYDNTNTTGELKYKDKQTQVGNHKVTIIATDVAGNKVEQLITVSVKIGTIKPAKPTFSFVDTGLLDNDGITNNGVIIVSGLKAGATWEYSISGDNGFTRGTGSFTLANNTTYEVNTIQIRQTDETGNVSDISKNTFKLVSFTDIVISCSALLPARSVATMVTISLLCTVACFSV